MDKDMTTLTKDIPEALSVELNRLQRLASDEARVNRRELHALYETANDLIGEVRYDMLWRLNQLQRICGSMERPIPQCTDWEELSQVRQAIADRVLNAVELRQELKSMSNKVPART